jgi:tetratricopeptide (TPR) repeat protein
LAQATTEDPKLRYRKEVEHFANRGKISVVGRITLDSLREVLGLSLDDATAIEKDVLNPHQLYQAKLQRYEQVFIEAIQGEQSLSEDTQNELRRLQQVLKLRDEDVEQIEAKITAQNKATPPVVEPVEPVPIVQPLPTEAITPVAPKKETVTVSRTQTPATSSIEIPKNPTVSTSGVKNPKVLIGGGIAALVLIFGVLIKTQVPGQKTEPVSTASPTASSNTSTETTGSSSSTNSSEALANSEEFYNKGFDKAAQKDYEGAIKDYSQAIKINKNWGADEPKIGYFGLSSAYFARATANYSLRQYPEAIADLDQAIKLSPENADAYYNRGLAKQNTGDKTGAIPDFQKAAELYKQQGRNNEAKDALEQANKLK